MILMNNNYLGNVRQWQAMFFGRRYSFTPMMNPDYMQIAAAYNIPARRVTEREELRDAIREMLDTDGPFLLEACVIEEGNVMPMTPPGGTVDKMMLECWFFGDSFMGIDRLGGEIATIRIFTP